MDEKRLHISLENLRQLMASDAKLGEMTLYDLSRLAEHLSDAFFEYHSEFDVLTAFSLLRENAKTDFSLSAYEDALPENRQWLKARMTANDVFCRLMFSVYFLNALEKKRCILSEGDFFPREKTERKIAFVQNPLSQEAFDVFSEEYGGFSAHPVLTVKDAVTALEEGNVGYCLIPLEEGDGHRIFAATDVLNKHDLKIVAVTPVYGFDGGADMKYALLSDSISVFPFSKEDDRYLEIRIPLEDFSRGFGFVADHFGFSVTALCSDRNERDAFCSLVLKSEGESFLPILVYLSLFSSDVFIVGLYKNLET